MADMIPFEQVQQEVENTLKKLINDVSKGNIFVKRNFIEALIISVANISIDFFENREKISVDALCRMWDILPDGKRVEIGQMLKEFELYKDDNVIID